MIEKNKHIEGNPLPWDYNPSHWDQRVQIAFIAMIAVGISLYMGLYQWGLIDTVWDPVFGDQTVKVLTSNASHTMSSWFRMPDAILGCLAYLGDVLFALGGSKRRWQYRPWLVILFGLDVIPLGIVGIILVIVQGAVVGSWCFLCIVSAIISLILIFLAYDEVWSTLIFLHRLWKKTKSRKILWKAFWGSPSQEAYEVGLSMVKE